MSAVQLSTPERTSTPLKCTVTSVSFQPFTFGAGAREALATGGVLSILTVGDVNTAEFPATSTTVTAPFTAEPSELSVNGLAGNDAATPDRLSAVVYAKETLVLFQPFAFAGGFAAPNI